MEHSRDYIPPPLTHRQVLVIFSSLMLGMLLAALDQTVLATALPTIVGDLGGLDHLSWVITSYMLAATASVPIYGKLGDLYGRKPLFQFSIVAFVVGSLAAGASQDMTQLIVFRGIQGLGAGGLMSMAQAIIGDILTARERGRYMGYMGLVFAFSSVAGPLIGGLFTDNLGWRWVFYINLPLGMAALVVTSRVLHLNHQRREHSIDYLGAVLMVTGVSCILLATSWGGREHAWDSTTILGLFTGGIVLSVLFVIQELRAVEPLLPLRLFRDRVFSASSGLGLLLAMSMFGAIAFLPLYLQVVKGVSATESGLRMLPLMIGMVSMSIFSGRMISKTGHYRIFPIVGTVCVTLGLFLLSTLEADTPFPVMAVYMLVLGVGMGLVMQVVTLAAQNAVDYRDMGVATAGVNFFRSMGGAFGVAIFGSILSNRLAHYLTRFVPGDVLNGIDPGALTASPERLRALPPAVFDGVVMAFSEAVTTVFLWAIPLAAVAVILALILPELPLRERPGAGPAPADDETREPVASGMIE